MYPFPATTDESQDIRLSMGITLASTFVYALALIPGQAVMFPIKERQVKTMHQQVISGVSLIAYWLANLIHDIILMLFPTVCAMILIQVFNSALKDEDNYACVCILLFLYGTAVHGLAYLISFLFTKPTSCQTFMIVLPCISFILTILGIFLQWTKVKHSEIYVFFFRLLPSGCLVDGLIRITLKDYFQWKSNTWENLRFKCCRVRYYIPRL
jgi:ATP-binding cassette subfamily A (ABC1) protein 3